MPYRVAGMDALYLLGLRIHALVHLLTYSLTYTVCSGRIKAAISPKRLKTERKLTAYMKSYMVFDCGQNV